MYFSEEKSVSKYNLIDKAGLKVDMTVKKTSIIKEKPHALHGASKNDVMKTEQHTSKAPSYKDTNSFEGRKSKAKEFPAPEKQQPKELFPNGQHTGVDNSCGPSG